MERRILLLLPLLATCGETVVPDPLPVAVAGRDLTVVLPQEGPTTVTLDGSRSYVPGRPGAVVGFTWALERGPAVDLPDSLGTPTVRLGVREPGLYVFSLVVSFAGRSSPPDFVLVSVVPHEERNTPPVPVVAVTPERALVGVPVLADGTSSHDPDAGDLIAAWAWTLTRPEGEPEKLAGERSARFVPDRPGTWEVALTVTDGRGAQATESALVPVVDCEPRGDEVCNGLDDDCDGETDEGFDEDADGVTSCGGDCDDRDPLRTPGAAELCDGRDNDCDG